MQIGADAKTTMMGRRYFMILSLFHHLLIYSISCCRGEGFRDDLHWALYRCRARNRLGTILSRLVRVKAGKYP